MFNLIRKVLAMAKKFFIRETPIDKLLEHVQTLEKKIDILSAHVHKQSHAPTAVYSTPVAVEPNVVDVGIAEEAPLFIPKARLGEASIKKVKTSLEAHDSEDVEKLKRKRKSS